MPSFPTVDTLKRLFPLSEQGAQFIQRTRQTCRQILSGEDPRFVAVVGPCSIHNLQEALEYATLLKKISPQVEQQLLPIMRVYVEKARTSIGWKGLIYDPLLNGQEDLMAGIVHARQLLVALAELGIGCATEFVDPLIAPYISDLISWGFIGARTSSSQPHRQLASCLPMPIGFKNSLDGNISTALHGIKAASHPHTFLFPTEHGTLEALASSGNPYTHLVLRGSLTEANHADLNQVYNLLKQENLNTKIMIDCSHGNAQGDFNRQQEVFYEAIKQRRNGHDALIGIMLESYLLDGKQDILDSAETLSYGVSITDPCLAWDKTAELLLYASDQLSSVTTMRST